VIQVVERVGLMLGAFTVERPEMTLTECAEETGLTKSSAHRLLLSLESVELVEREGNRWRLGPRVVRLAAVRLGQFELRREAVVRLRELCRSLRAAAAFSVPSGSDMIYVERQESPDPFAASARLGGLAPIWAGASGKAVLAQLEPSERARRLDTDEWYRLGHETRNEILDEVERARERGFAVDPGTFFQGISGVAVAVRDPYGYPIAALSLIVSPERLQNEDVEAIGEQLMAVGAELESLAGQLPAARVPEAWSPAAASVPLA
jgi:IclR family pca regulon transcriptional regulator